MPGTPMGPITRSISRVEGGADVSESCPISGAGSEPRPSSRALPRLWAALASSLGMTSRLTSLA